MTDSPKRSHADTSDVELETRQLTLEDWAPALRAIPGTAATPVLPSRAKTDSAATSHRPSATELLETPDALLTRTHLRELGLERRAIDAVFRALAVVALPGYSRPMVRVRDFLELLERCTFRDDRVRPIAGAS